MRNVALICARGGSKRIPRKNIAMCNGRKLIEWSLMQKENCKYIDDIYVSTEDDEIKEVAKSFGAIVIDRPPEFASDVASDGSVLNHAFQFINLHDDVDYLFRLFCTSPCVRGFELDEAMELLLNNSWANQVGSVNRVVKSSDLNHYQVLLPSGELVQLFQGNQGFSPYTTNNLVPLYETNGAFGIMRFKDFIYSAEEIGNYEYGDDVNQEKIFTDRFQRKIAWNKKIRMDKILGYVIDKYSAIDINYPEDLIIAESILKYREKK